jgi:mono/diheme cytochrome c family protein
MNKKRAIRLFGGAAAVVAAGAALLAVSGMANGLENPALETTLAPPAQHSETRIQLAQADAAPVETPVSYSAEQADRGEEDFTDDCEACHGDDLRGGLLGGPPLRGVNFESKYFYEGAPAGALFEVMSTTMPPNAPGRYSAETYADLLAYILKRNGFAAGAELPSDVDALYNLTMEK